MIPRKLFDESVRWTILLERIKAGEVRNMDAALDKAYRAFEKVLRAAGSLDSLSRTAVEQMVAQSRQAFLEAELAEITSHVERMTELAGDSVDTLAGMIQGAAAPGFTPGIVQVQAREAMAQALRAPLETNGDLLEPFLRGSSNTEAQRIANAARKAWSDGLTTDQAIARIKGTKSRRFQDGQLAVSKRNMATVVRTSVSHVNSQAQAVFMAENADLISGYRWVSTLDGDTSSVCRSLDGQRFKLDDKSAPKPPAHPNCRSSTVPDLNEKYDWLSEGGTRSSENGYVDRNQTYYSWLKKQPAAYQDEVIGATRGKLLRNGGLTSEEFAALNLNRNFEPLTLAEMRKKKPAAFKQAGL